MPTATSTRKPTTTAVLSKAERVQLTQHEDVIATAQRWQREEAKALLAIRDGRLYRATHRTFEDYGRERWAYELSHLYRICGWGEVLAAVSPIGEMGPSKESHARPLLGLKPEQQRKIWADVTRKFKNRHTAENVESVVRDHLRPTAPAPSKNVTPSRTDGSVVAGDCRKAVEALKTATVDLCLFSPPYCEQRKGQYPGVPEAEYPDWMVSVLQAVHPKMKDTGNVLVVAREHLRDGQISDVWLRTRLAVRASGWTECETLIWHKSDAPPLGRPDRPRRTWEYVFWFAKQPNPFVDLRACGSPPKETRTTMIRPRRRKSDLLGWENRQRDFSRFRGDQTARVTDLVTCPIGGGISAGIGHVAMMPTTLADQLIRTYSPAGGLVIDPTCGSGTTLVAARDAGRNWWGCDVVPSFVRLARRRLAEQS